MRKMTDDDIKMCGFNILKEVHSFLQVVNIETDEDIIGFGIF